MKNLKEIILYMWQLNKNTMNRNSIILIAFFVVGICPIAMGQKYANLASHSTTVILNGISEARKKTFEQNTKSFLDEINKAYLANNPNIPPRIPITISNDKLNETIGNLWAVSPFLSVRTEVIENVLSTSQGNFEVRNLQIILEEADSTYNQQDAVLIFDISGRIIDFKIAMGFHSISTILNSNVSVTDLRRRQMIISFVEDFRTAYNLRNVNFLESVFSDKAIIITGKVLEKTSDGELKPVVFKKQTKTEYLNNLRLLLSSLKMINVNFDSISVVQHPTNQGLYGVTLMQTWNTVSLKGGSYHDVGYVFLIIDFFKEEKPKVWVRTWQDKKNAKNDHGVFSFNHFNIK